MVQWLAPWTLNPIIRVQISVGPFFNHRPPNHNSSLPPTLINLTTLQNILDCLPFLLTILVQFIEYSELQGPFSMEALLHLPKEPSKIKTLDIFTKFQEARPAYCSNLINKELGYDTIVELPEQVNPIKIKNCITSARSNSELFKRFSKTLIKNIKNDVDQLLFFTSLHPLARLQTSIGVPTNPGIFLIMGLTYLDEKYKEAYQKCDIEFAFLQFREGMMFDLLCYTGQPLTPQQECFKSSVTTFRQHWARATTFSQFIKLFKVALFNNKQRDFKSESWSERCRSTFIMKIRNKLYSQEGVLVRSQETVLMDFEVSCMKESSAYLKQKSGGRNILDYILIEIHNSNPSNKPIHYHMVEENHLLLMIKDYLSKRKEQGNPTAHKPKENAETQVGGQIIIVNCIPSSQDTFSDSLQYLNAIISTTGEPWQAKACSKPKQMKQFNHGHVETQLKNIVEGVVVNTYSSLRHFFDFKQQIVSQIKRCKNVVRELRRSINASLREKIELTFLKNEFLAYELKLIGSCIKSDHFKDFYNAKSYIQLEREVSIKTETIKEDIKRKTKVLQEAETKFFNLRKKESLAFLKFSQGREFNKEKGLECLFQNSLAWQALSGLGQSKQNWDLKYTRVGQSKFKKISYVIGEDRQLQQLKILINYLTEYMYTLWDNYILFDERTVSNSISFEEMVIREEGLLFEMTNKFMEELENIKETDVMCEQDNNVHHSNQVGLFRSLNFLGLMGPKKVVKGCEIGKRLIVLQDHNQKSKFRNSICSKLPSIKKLIPIVIEGNLKISSLLTNPNSAESRQQSLHD